MDKGYRIPGVDFFESEILPERRAPQKNVIGIIGLAPAGSFEPTMLHSIRELHEKFGYAYIGLDSGGKRVISQAITAAERALECTDEVIFCRLGLKTTESTKFRRISEDKLNFTIANNDTTVQSVKISKNAANEVTVLVTKTSRYGTLAEYIVASGVKTAEDLKLALEYEGTLVDVTVPEDYITDLTEDTYVPAFAPLACQITNEFDYFNNIETVDVSILVAPLGTWIEATTPAAGITDKYNEINNRLIEVAKERGDCVVVLDYKTDMMYNEWKSVFGNSPYLNLDCDQATTCYPAVKIKNQYTNDIIEASASVIMSRQMVYTDKIKQCWFAPAGFGDSKGVITDIVELNCQLTKTQKEEVYALRVNPVVKFLGRGVTLWGNKTFKATKPYTQDSYFCQLSIRRLVNFIRKLVIFNSMNTIFEPNDSLTWKNWVNTISPYLEEIKQNRGVYRYRVIMDETTVSDDDILNGRAPAKIFVHPIGAIEYIPVNFVLTPEDVYFVAEEDREATV